jgi:transposase
VHKRFSRWASSGVWKKVFHELVRDLRNQYLMIDSAIVRAHQQVATGRKKGARTKALARSRGRWNDEDPSAGR